MTFPRVETLRQFHEAMDATVAPRRALTGSKLAGREPDLGGLRLLERTLLALEAVPEDGPKRRIRLDESRSLQVDLGYEIEELQRDLIYLLDGEEALQERLERGFEGFERGVAACVDAIGTDPYRTFITDRDGTVNNYCGRYASSVQSVYNAVFLCGFAKTVGASILLTSGPLAELGITDLSVMPTGTFVMAGSKGREYLDANGDAKRFPIGPAKQARLDELNSRLTAMMRRRDLEIFSLVGSGCQHKFGQTTVAYQDINGSVETSLSQAFRSEIKQLLWSIDEAGDQFRIEDTGLDLELILTVDTAPGAKVRDFDKGDGLRFLSSKLDLGIEHGPALVCGDTASDLAMMAAAAELAPQTQCILVTQDPSLIAMSTQQFPSIHIVPTPDVLVAALRQLSQG